MPTAVRLVRGLVAPIVSICFRPTLAGIENLSASSPFLLAANHSAGAGIAQILSFIALYLRILSRSKTLAMLLGIPWLLGLRRWGISFLGLIGTGLILTLVPVSWPARTALVWLWLGSPLIFLTLVPWSIRMRVGVPIPPSALFTDGDEPDRDGQFQRALTRVQAAVQAQVDHA